MIRPVRRGPDAITWRLPRGPERVGGPVTLLSVPISTIQESAALPDTTAEAAAAEWTFRWCRLHGSHQTSPTVKGPSLFDTTAGRVRRYRTSEIRRHPLRLHLRHRCLPCPIWTVLCPGTICRRGQWPQPEASRSTTTSCRKSSSSETGVWSTDKCRRWWRAAGARLPFCHRRLFPDLAC